VPWTNKGGPPPAPTDERTLDPAIGGKTDTSTADRAITELADRQHGVVGRAQLLDLGVGSRAIEHRLEKGRLHTIHRGVYAVGHRALVADARWMAAVLAAGPGAALSHRSAAALWGIRPSARPVIEVTAARRARPGRGIQPHRGRLPDDEVTTVVGIPVTTVPRTLLDIAAVLPRHQVERAINEAEVRRLGDPLPLAVLLARYPCRRGVAVARAILDDSRIGSTITRSELEERFLAFLIDHRLPRPEVNANIRIGNRSIECDFAWPRQSLIAELDGQAFHATTATFERDRARDRALNVAGWRVVRITWLQLHVEATALAADLRRLLGLRASATASRLA
jgi:very-short-patch-repair endonuclease